MKKEMSLRQREKNMSLGIKEGSASTVTSIITETYMTPFALALGANNVHVGFLNSFSGLLAPLSQLYGSRVLERHERKRVWFFSALWQMLVLIPILLLGVFFLFDVEIGLPSFLILFYSLYVIFGALAAMAWFSLMGDVVPQEQRGWYFGKRNAILGGIGVVVTLAGSFLLDYFKTGGIVLLGFSLLFLIAIIARGISLVYLRRQDDPDGKGRRLHDGFFHFLKSMRRTNYGRFVLYVAFLNFAVMIASPFFTVYMLEELKLSYVWYTIISLSQAISMMIFMLVWGKFADRYGNKALLIIGNVLVPILPLLWIFHQNPFYLLIPMFLGGIGWAAFNLASSNFIYDSVEKEKRAAYLAYLNVFAGVGIFLGAGLGGFLIEYLPLRFMNIFLFVFLISAVLRMVAGVVFLPFVREVRRVERFSLGKITPLLHLKMLGHHTSLQHHHGVHYHGGR